MSDEDTEPTGPSYPRYPGEQPANYPPAPSDPSSVQPGSYPPPPGTPGPTDGGRQYASWGLRLAAYLLDGVFGAIVYLPFYIPAMIMLGTTEMDPITGEFTEDPNPLAFVLMGLAILAGLAFAIWNLIIRQGRRGQSLGKQVVDIQVIREDGRFMGGWLALGRLLLFSILTTCTCYINALWPLWDAKKQALHDKVVSTVVVKK